MRGHTLLGQGGVHGVPEERKGGQCSMQGDCEGIPRVQNGKVSHSTNPPPGNTNANQSNGHAHVQVVSLPS